MTRLMLAAAAAALLSAPAFAAETADGVPVTTVSVKTTDFNNPKQVGRLYDKITIAVREVCDPKSPDQASQLERKACERDRMEQAVRAVGAPQLTALYDQGRASSYAGR